MTRLQNRGVFLDNRMYIGTEDLGNLKVILFSSFNIFAPSFLLTIKKCTFCFVLFCKSDEVISKIEIMQDN